MDYFKGLFAFYFILCVYGSVLNETSSLITALAIVCTWYITHTPGVKVELVTAG